MAICVNFAIFAHYSFLASLAIGRWKGISSRERQVVFLSIKKYFMKIATKLFMGLASLSFLSCSTDMGRYVMQEEGEKTYNNFDFSTVNDNVSLEVGYLDCGVSTSVYFEIYDENPVNDEGATLEKKDGVKPLFCGYTDEDGVYKGTIALPSYVKSVYVYTPAFYARTLMTADVQNGRITAYDNEQGQAASKATRAATDGDYNVGYSYMTRTDVPKEYSGGKRWKEWLGSYDSNGRVGYAYKGTDLVPNKNLYDIHSQLINVNKDCPQAYRNSADLAIKEDAEVVVTYLGGNTCWNSSLGYYYYKEGQAPASIDDADVIMIFPNTQDGKWCKTTVQSDKDLAGVDRMTSVKLKFYPNIANNDMNGATDVFPAGYKVGLVLATNAWSKRLTHMYGSSVNWTGNHRYYRAATNPAMCVKQSGGESTTACAASYYVKGKDMAVVSFEDDYRYDDGIGADQNFSDVVLAIGTNPVNAISNIPEMDGLNVDGSGMVHLAETKMGMYLFEDLWPSAGDYDMNDVIVEYFYGRNLDKWNDTYGEEFSFRVYQNYATKKNGIGFKVLGGERDEVNGSGSATGRKIQGYQKPHSVKLLIDGTEQNGGLEYDEEEGVYYVTDDVKKHLGSLYTVKFEHIYSGAPAKYERNYKGYTTKVSPFIFRRDQPDGKQWEVHCRGIAPTSKMNMALFGTEDDASDPSKGVYYVREGIYPFALYLSGAAYTDIERLLDRSLEGHAIDKMFPLYKEWVNSNGVNNANWYK